MINEDLIKEYNELYKKEGYIKYLRKFIGHAPILSCGCGVIIENDKGEILLQKRKDNGKWAILGGAMEMGETYEEAIRREVKEEASLTLGKLDIFKIYSGKDCIIEYPNGDICFGVGVICITKDFDGEIVNQKEEVLEHRFFSKDEIPENLNKYDDKIIYYWVESKR